MTTDAQASTGPLHALHALHGDLAFWLFAVAELLTVGVGLLVFAVVKGADPEQAAVLHGALHQNLALINTLILLSSGALIAAAVTREARGAGAKGLWVGALLIGVGFLGVKGYEFSAMFAAGHGINGGSLMTGYFLLTGFHYLHVALGILFISGVVLKRLRPPPGAEGGLPTEVDRSFGASAGVFWHSLDLMWIVIFAVVYA